MFLKSEIMFAGERALTGKTPKTLFINQPAGERPPPLVTTSENRGAQAEKTQTWRCAKKAAAFGSQPMERKLYVIGIEHLHAERQIKAEASMANAHGI